MGEEARDAGEFTNEAILKRAVDDVKSRRTRFAVENPDLRKNHPKSLFVWRSNLISSSAKGQEYFMKHLLGTKSALMAEPNETDKPSEIEWGRYSRKTRLTRVIRFPYDSDTTLFRYRITGSNVV